MKASLKLFCASCVLLTALTVQAQSGSGLWGMGYNLYGQLGIGNYNATNQPIAIVSNNVTAVSAAGNYTMFLKFDGSLWAMGDDSEGQLGDGRGGNNIQTNLPEQVATNVLAVAAGLYHSAYIKNDGSLWAVGHEQDGELGNGTYGSFPYWISNFVMIEPSNVTAVAAGYYHTLFIKNDGSLWAMGENLYGQLGDGTTDGGFQVTNLPEKIVPGGVATIAAGADHSLFLTTNGALWVMGDDQYGQLGDGTNGVGVMTNLPEQILASNVVAIAGGQDHSLFVKSDGSLWGMGYNLDGELGIGTTSNVSTPVEIVPSNVVAVAAGQFHSLFVKSDGSLWVMGKNDYGALGDGTASGSESLLPEMIVSNGVLGISAGYFHSVFIAPTASPAGPPEIAVYQGSSLITNGQTNSTVSFGTVQEGEVGPVVSFVITNVGAQTLRLGIPTLPTGFALIGYFPVSIAAGAEGGFSVQMATTTPGTNSGQITFTNNVSSNSTFSFGISGVVTPLPARIDVFVGSTAITNNQTNAAADFGAIQQGTAEPIVTFTVSNVGGQIVNLGLLSVPPGFMVVTNPNEQIYPGTATTFSVQLSTATAGPFAGLVTFTNNDPTNNPFSFPITGRVVDNYSLTVAAYPPDGGTVSGWGTYPAGVTEYITALTNGGFQFVGWTGAATGTNSTVSIKITTNLVAVANFVPVSQTNITLTVNTNGAGTVTPAYDGTTVRKGARYILTAKASSGNLFANWTGSITTNKNPLTIVAEETLVLQANFVTNAFMAAQGIFNGLFSPTNGVTQQTSGMLKGLKLTAEGKYTGTILLAGESKSISGAFGLDGQATNQIRREPAQGGLVTLVMMLNPGLPPQITGTLSNADWQSILLADQATNVFPSAAYTALLLPDTSNSPPDLSPGGAGYLLITNYPGTAKNPASAATRISGALADGMSLSENIPLSETGYIPLYASLYNGAGLFMGWFALDPTNTSRLGLTWICPARVNHLSAYREGFTNLLSSNQILLSAWTNAAVEFTGLTNLALLNSAADRLSLTNTTVEISTSGKITGTAIKGMVTPKTGYFKATVNGATAYGAVLPEFDAGGGYYLTRTNSQAIKLQP